MGHRRFAAQWLKLLAVAGLVGSALVGCGEDGDPGPAGSSGVVIAPISGATALDIAITGVTVSSPPVVTFRVTNQNGESVTGLTANDVRFTMAKLVPGTFGNSAAWQSYINSTSNGAFGTRVQATREGGTSGSLAGTFTANGDGTYKYRFATDITNVTSPLRVTYEANLTHRVGVQTRGTLPLANATYTFRPSDGATAGIFTRDIVKTASCNQCHGTLQAHDQRIETKYCVTCHNPGSSDPDSGNTVDFKVMIHKIHMGEHLPSVQAGGSYQIIGYGGSVHDYSEVVFPQDIRNCTKCHDGADPATPQGGNWQLQPSREACGSCHDNVNFDTGAGHAGGIQRDSSTCLACHSTGGEVGPVADSHVLVEMTNTTPGTEAGRAAFQNNLPAGAKKVEYQIKSVTVSGTPQRATVQFRILMDGVPQALNAFAPGASMLTGFTGGPSFYVAYAVPQDGITTPADFNVNASAPNVSLATVWDGTRGTLSTPPDSDGYYTAVLGGGTGSYLSVDVPLDATMVTVAMINAFAQTGLPGYPGGLTLITPAVMKTATGYTARRVMVSRESCNNCHATLGISPTFHGGNRNDPQTCALCHNMQGPSSTRSWSARSSAFVHAIHGAGKRTVDFNWHGDQEYWKIGFPGILNKCETCHEPGTYDFSGSAYTTTLLGNLLFSYVATGTPAADISVSPYVVGGTNYGARFSSSTRVQAAATTLVTSPIATVCFSCHDGSLPKLHMESYGAVIYGARGPGATLTNTEQCLTCHGPGKVAAIAEMHAK